MSGHTPGPWVESYQPQHRMRIFANDGKATICDVALWTVDYGEQQANARLIASAPEMMEALRRALRYFEDASNGREPSNRLMQALRDVVSKAEGK